MPKLRIQPSTGSYVSAKVGQSTALIGEKIGKSCYTSNSFVEGSPFGGTYSDKPTRVGKKK